MVPDQLRIKQGPLARAWLASHWERKVSKSHVLQTNLEKTIDAITTTSTEQGQMTLRISGQLLLGVARIYSRKTKYLLEDCNEALVKIKLAFKKGDVNMPNIQHSVANNNTITLQDNLTEFDILLPDIPFNATIDGNLEYNDPLFDALGESSQSNTLNDLQNSFTFDHWEAGRDGMQPLMGNPFDNVEAGRRDAQALDENHFNVDDMEGAIKELNLADRDNGLNNNDIDFHFEDNEVEYGLHDITDDGAAFDVDAFNALANADAAPGETTAMSSLGDIGIVEDPIFDTDSIMAEPTPRKRRLLVVDKVTEISADDLTRYISDASSLLMDDETVADASTKETTKTKRALNLKQPNGEALGSDLYGLFESIRHKRSTVPNTNTSDALLMNDLGAATSHTPANIDENAFHFEDNDVAYGDDGADFNAEAFEHFQAKDDELMDMNEASMMTQNTQSINNNTMQTLERLESEFTQQETVRFSNLATASTSKSDAARLFYDVLLLTTKNKIKVNQAQPFGDIQIRAVAV